MKNVSVNGCEVSTALSTSNFFEVSRSPIHVILGANHSSSLLLIYSIFTPILCVSVYVPTTFIQPPKSCNKQGSVLEACMPLKPWRRNKRKSAENSFFYCTWSI